MLQHVPILGGLLRGVSMRAIKRVYEDILACLDKAGLGLKGRGDPACCLGPSALIQSLIMPRAQCRALLTTSAALIWPLLRLLHLNAGQEGHGRGQERGEGAGGAVRGL